MSSRVHSFSFSERVRHTKQQSNYDHVYRVTLSTNVDTWFLLQKKIGAENECTPELQN